MQFFYDKQIRRFIIQFIRVFSEFYVEYGKDDNNNIILHRVPVRYANTNKQASAILNNNSSEVMNSVPMMVCYVTGLSYDRDRMQEPSYVETRQIRERSIDPVTGEYTTGQKQAFTLERMMPVPYRLSMKVDIWTSSYEQKLQLFEQLAVLFNPSLEIQSTDNYLDWTSLSVIQLTDTTWSSRDIPVGTEENIDVSSMSFEIPIWITAPAKLKKLGVVKKIVASIYDASGNLDDSVIGETLVSRQFFTPLGYNIIALNGQLQLIRKNGPVKDNGDIDAPEIIGAPINWKPLLGSLGEITDGITQVYLEDNITGHRVVGTVAYHPTDNSILLFTVDPDTIPSNTLGPVTTIIDPLKVAPDAGLPAPALGQRYLILNDIGNQTNSPNNQPIAWRNNDGTTTLAHENDIIQWNGNNWAVMFDSRTEKNVQYVTNLYTGIQYKWTGEQWLKSWEGYYAEGFWSIEI